MAKLVVKGYRELIKHLDEVEPGLRKATMKEINSAARVATKAARGYVPADPGLSGWDKANYKPGDAWYNRAYVAAEIVRGIQTKRGSSRKSRRGYVNEIGVTNKTAAGMIYELAGSKSDGRTPSGRVFIQQIASTGLHTPLRRVVVRAVVEEGPAVAKRIQAVLQAVERKFNMKERTSWR